MISLHRWLWVRKSPILSVIFLIISLFLICHYLDTLGIPQVLYLKSVSIKKLRKRCKTNKQTNINHEISFTVGCGRECRPYFYRSQALRILYRRPWVSYSPKWTKHWHSVLAPSWINNVSLQWPWYR